ncbi:MAG: hypothetical protein SGJ20_16815 [Planctomycetota bacterium]|nr:hypothetical protein [Planctomycetota bacterium]
MKTNLNNKLSITTGLATLVLAVAGWMSTGSDATVLVRDGSAPRYPTIVEHLNDGKDGNTVLGPEKFGDPILSPEKFGDPILSPEKFGDPILSPEKFGDPILGEDKFGDPILSTVGL